MAICEQFWLLTDGDGNVVTDENGQPLGYWTAITGPEECPSLDPADAPPIQDALSDPSLEVMAPLVQALAPRGPAWRTDEVAQPGKASLMGGMWKTIAAMFADFYRDGFTTAAQAYPSAVEFGIGDWEIELGLPDRCLFDPSSFEGRKRAVQIKYRDRGGASPWYFICLLRSIGYEATIEEPQNFECGISECGGCDETSLLVLEVYWIIKLTGLDAFYFRTGESVAGDRLSDWNAAIDAECIIRARAPEHTVPIFNYIE